MDPLLQAALGLTVLAFAIFADAPVDVAVVEVTAILPGGLLVPSSSVGNNKTWLDQADRIILEVNAWQPEGLQGMHDIYYGTRLPPHRQPIIAPPEEAAPVAPPSEPPGPPKPAPRPRSPAQTLVLQWVPWEPTRHSKPRLSR